MLITLAKRLSPVIVLVVVGCDGGFAPTEPTPLSGGALASQSEQGPVSEGGAPGIEATIAFFEKVAADPQMREVWSFGSTRGPVTVDRVLEELHQLRPPAEVHSGAPDPSEVSPADDDCYLIGYSGIGSTGGMPPGGRIIIFRAVTMTRNRTTGEGCGVLSLGGEASIRLDYENGGGNAHAANLTYRSWFSYYADGTHTVHLVGEHMRGLMNTRFYATGVGEDFEVRTANGL